MKIAAIIIRTLFGALLLFGSVVYFLKLYPVPEIQGPLREFNEGMAATGYMMNVIKGIELVCGLAFVSGFFVPLATVVIFPISLNIFLLHATIAPQGFPVSIFVLGANLFLAFYYRDKYAPMFTLK